MCIALLRTDLSSTDFQKIVLSPTLLSRAIVSHVHCTAMHYITSHDIISTQIRISGSFIDITLHCVVLLASLCAAYTASSSNLDCYFVRRISTKHMWTGYLFQTPHVVLTRQEIDTELKCQTCFWVGATRRTILISWQRLHWNSWQPLYGSIWDIYVMRSLY